MKYESFVEDQSKAVEIASEIIKESSKYDAKVQAMHYALRLVEHNGSPATTIQVLKIAQEFLNYAVK